MRAGTGCRAGRKRLFLLFLYLVLYIYFFNNVVTDVVNRMLVIELFFFFLCQLNHSRALYAVKQNARNYRVHIAPHHGEVIVVLRLN